MRDTGESTPAGWCGGLCCGVSSEYAPVADTAAGDDVDSVWSPCRNMEVLDWGTNERCGVVCGAALNEALRSVADCCCVASLCACMWR